MKLGRLFFITLVVLGFALGGLWYQNHRSQASQDSRRGEMLLKDPYSEASRISMIQGDERVDLVKGAERWEVEQRKNFPVNAEKLRKLLLSLAREPIAEVLPPSEGLLAKLGLLTPEEAAEADAANSGSLLQIGEAGDQIVYTILFGNSRAPTSGGYGGQYVRFPPGEQAILIANPVTLETNPQNWLQNDVFAMVDAKDKLREMRIGEGKSRYTLFRKEEGDALLLKGKEKSELDAEPLRLLENKIRSMRFGDLVLEDTDKPASMGRARTQTVELEFFSGLIFRVVIGEKEALDGKRALSFTARASTEGTGLEEKIAGFNALYQDQFLLFQSWEVEQLVPEEKALLGEK